MLLGVPVSPGFVDLASERLASRLQDAGFDGAMQAALATEPVLAADETPVNLTDPHAGLAEQDAGAPHVLVVRTPYRGLTWLRALGSRQHAAITAILAFFTGLAGGARPANGGSSSSGWPAGRPSPLSAGSCHRPSAHRAHDREWVGNYAWFGWAALPVSIGIAILRYRLYDIDRIISRTLAYAIVTGLLVGVYAGLVLLATRVLSFHTPVAVAASTLAAAALFNPLRRRVQRAVDRRFNRARYNAGKTVAAFAARLQDAVDLDAVQDDLAGVVHQALEPAHVSVWISQRD